MSRKSLTVAAIVLTMALLVSVSPSARVAVGQEVITGTVTGVSVSAGGTWMHDAATGSSDGVVDTLVFTSGNANFVLNSGVADVNQVLAVLPADGTVTDIDVAGTYALRSVDRNGAAYGLFSVVVGNGVQTIIAPADAFAAAVGDAQANITVDGVPVLGGVDGPALAGSFPVSGAATGPLIGSGAPAGESAAPAADAPVGTGFVDDNTWVSPRFGTVITWGDEWEPRITDDDPGFTSWTTRPNDRVCLYSPDEALAEVNGAAPSICLNITERGDFETQEQWQERYASPGGVGAFGHPYFNVEITETGYIAADTAVDESYAYISQGHHQDGVMYVVTLSGPTDALPGLLASAQTDITFDEQPALFLVDPTTFQAEYDAKVATLPELAAQREAELQALGLVEPNRYQSVATGCDVSWQDPWRLSGALQPVNREGVYAGNEVPRLPGEEFSLLNRVIGNSVRISCVTSLDSLEQLPDFVPHTNRKTVEGTNIYYAIVGLEGSATRDGVPLYSIAMVVKPVGAPTVVVSVNFLTKEGVIELLDEVEPGMLVVNGVDVFQEMKHDDIASQIP